MRPAEPGSAPDLRLPLTVIAGYLGAGKTTLINRLLQEPHGRRLLVMVNDFGAINIDAGLIAHSDADTLALTNGCVCCTMGGDLFMAIGDVLDRQPRPDQLLIEASGVADPARIAAVADTEPELAFGGIATVVDGPVIGDLLADPQIGAQIAGQIRPASCVLVSKLDQDLDDGLDAAAEAIAPHSRCALMDLAKLEALSPLLLESPVDNDRALTVPDDSPVHPAYRHWQHDSDRAMRRDALDAKLAQLPPSLYRLKGWVRDAESDGGWLVQCVGGRCELRPRAAVDRTRLVGIGLAGQVTQTGVEGWWAA